MFISNSSKINQTRQIGSSNLTNLLFKAAEENNWKALDLFHLRGVDMQSLNGDGETVLHVAVRERNFETVEFILTNKLLNPDIKSSNGLPPTFLTDSVTMLNLLIRNGASIEETNSYGIPLLHHAASQNRGRIVSELIEVFKQDVNKRDPEEKTPLHFAAAVDALETVYLLLKLGADADAQTNILNTPLHYVITAKHKTDEVARLLLGRYGNARYNIKNSRGQRPIDLTHANSVENQQNGVRDCLLSEPTLNAARIHSSRKKLF